RTGSIGASADALLRARSAPSIHRFYPENPPFGPIVPSAPVTSRPLPPPHHAGEALVLALLEQPDREDVQPLGLRERPRDADDVVLRDRADRADALGRRAEAIEERPG